MLTATQAIALAQIEKALRGDTAAAKFVRETLTLEKEDDGEFRINVTVRQ